MLHIDRLTVNETVNPLGVDTPRPRFSWLLSSAECNQRQSAYHIRAWAEDGQALWDTGQVRSADSIQVEYQGAALSSRQRVLWQVRVWDQEGRASLWSPVGEFEMGLVEAEDWHGHWIGHPAGAATEEKPVPSPLMRTFFEIPEEVIRARAYVVGLGFFELRMNGEKVGEDVLAPPFTRYDRTVLYRVLDVTRYCRPGENVVGVMLGNGFYNVHVGDVWNFPCAEWRDQPKCLVQLEITLKSGRTLEVVSGPQWECRWGPIRWDGIRNGEHYDAREEVPGWDCPGASREGWQPVKVVRSPGGILRAQLMPPAQVVRTVRPISRRRVGEATYVFDLGLNIAGWARIRVSGPRGTPVTIKYGEILDERGHVDTEKMQRDSRIGGQFQTDVYTLKGEGVEEWEPRFVYHGFQYLEITGWPGEPRLKDVEGRIVHTNLRQRGTFRCANELLNKIQAAAVRSSLNNYQGYPTDCPHREKNGWTGDAALSAEQMLWNFDVATAYAKWLNDIADAQRPSGQLPGIVPTSGWGYNWGSGPSWDIAVVLLPWLMYVYLGDRAILARTYETMRRYFCYAWSMTVDGIAAFGLGDWCPPVGLGSQHQCPTAVTDTGSVYAMAMMLSKIAGILQKPQDQEEFLAHAEKIRDAFRARFWDPARATVESHCQTAVATAIYHRLLEAEDERRAFDTLLSLIRARDNHLDTGILGAKYVMHCLRRYHRNDVAYALATQTTFPSWGYEILQGATTLWERWDGAASRDHHMYSDISAWFYEGLGGIEPDPEDPGFHHVLVSPNPPPQLPWAEVTHDSPYGLIAVRWEWAGRDLHLWLTIPVNSYATVTPPDGFAIRAMEETGGFWRLDCPEGLKRYDLGSGRYFLRFGPG
ncbi:MAG: family 78 glycoside hydrolase catalytic domain [Firmicutes bacterium]|nr:family 78 glycoside hydrolase catalytic domain [Bacillota bacterium]